MDYSPACICYWPSVKALEMVHEALCFSSSNHVDESVSETRMSGELSWQVDEIIQLAEPFTVK